MQKQVVSIEIKSRCIGFEFEFENWELRDLYEYNPGSRNICCGHRKNNKEKSRGKNQLHCDDCVYKSIVVIIIMVVIQFLPTEANSPRYDFESRISSSIFSLRLFSHCQTLADCLAEKPARIDGSYSTKWFVWHAFRHRPSFLYLEQGIATRAKLLVVRKGVNFRSLETNQVSFNCSFEWTFSKWWRENLPGKPRLGLAIR